ncbi:hypothetical protein HPB52_014112 [Rhipicephalus sanguineus]|uniref:Uncharacterized protein n=1 Tax=Rhipicephalus sanguineus TaxID=34632 RepID=A0A9D4YQ51_RHISA|nr:hypothetical protein HPB52_014112 [Rhipicephalus sanguineus]
MSFQEDHSGTVKLAATCLSTGRSRPRPSSFGAVRILPHQQEAALVLNVRNLAEPSTHSTIEEIDPDQVDELIRHLNLLKQTINEDEEELELSRMRLKRDNNFLHKELAKQREKVHMLREARSADDQNARPPTYANPRSRRRGQRGGVLFASPASASSGHSEMAEGGQ